MNITYFLAIKDFYGNTEIFTYDNEVNLILTIWAFLEAYEFEVPMALSYIKQ
jgi:hypothetical protein